jgi:hypothetical protein
MMNELSARMGLRTPIGRLAGFLGGVLALLLVFAALASAEEKFVQKIGSEGSAAGQYMEPAALATDPATGRVYVADRQNNRIQVLNESGEFIEAWGYDVVTSGPDNKPAGNEVQRINIKAVGGTFTLAYGGQTTAPIAFNASAGTVESALNGLSSISAGGGSVSVTGGPGDATGANPYVVTFGGGPLAGGDREEMTVVASQLAKPVGTELECEGTSPVLWSEGTPAYQWLANGQPISGATASIYTTTAADSGKAIQCQVEGIFEPFSAPKQFSWDTNREYTVVGSFGAQAPPLGPASIAAPAGTVQSPGPAGQTLTCNAGSWSNSPTSYTYQWYLGYKPYGSPKTTAATSDQITLSEQDVSERTVFQCSVTAINAGGSSTLWSEVKRTNPGPEGGVTRALTAVFVHGSGYPVATKANGGVVFETCKPSDVCKAGVAGTGLGQFSRPRGVAVDTSPGGGGAVYVGDDSNYRVQKLSPNGTPILEFGGRVDKTTNENLCIVASGDDCGAGVKIRTNRLGFLRGNPCPQSTGCEVENYDVEIGSTVAVDPNNGMVFVVDAGDFYENSRFVKPRTMSFDNDGHVIGQVFVPNSTLFDFVRATTVAVDDDSRVLLNIDGENPQVELVAESEFTPEGTERGYTERTSFHEGFYPLHLALDPNSRKIWMVDRNSSFFGSSSHVCGEPQSISPRRALLAYDYSGHRLDCTVPQGIGAIQSAGGLTVTEGHQAFVSLRKQNVIKIYQLPLEIAPTVGDTSVDNVATQAATLHGEVNPGFEATEYAFEYGSSPCSSSTCTKLNGAETVNGIKPVTVEGSATGLEPGTKYYYRLVATNQFGDDAGAEGTFVTYPFVDLRNDVCPNALARKQTRAAGLLDCRAYELASASFTGGYDVISDLAPGAEPWDGFPDATDKVLYAVRDGGIPGTGNPTNRGPDPYVATRGEDGWTTKYVGIPADGTPSTSPFSSTVIDADGGLNLFAFGGQICTPCFGDGSSGVPVHRPDGTLVQGMQGSIPQPGAVPAGYVGDPMSADGTHLIFGSTSQFEEDGNDNGDVTIYDRDLSLGTTQVVSTLADGSTMTGSGIGELDVSADGSRVLVGRKLGTDAAENSYWHPYLHVGSASESLDLAPGTTSGVLYLGSSADGTAVFYATRDQLVASDTDTSIDVYEAEASGSGPITPKLISGPGGAGDACEPAGVPNSWNSISGSGKCDAVGFAGGAGVAGDGTVYFLSPELLAGPGNGEPNEANLYVVRPGGSTEFVATIGSSAGTTPPPPKHPVVNGSLISGLSNPGSLAVDQSSGDIYVAEPGAGDLKRFTAAGAAHPFSEGPNAGSNTLTGQEFASSSVSEVAVDSASSSPMNGSFYTTQLSGVNVYSNTGKALGALTGFSLACGVAVDQSTGAVYVADPFTGTGRIWRFMPTSAPSPGVTNANYSVTSIEIEAGFVCQLAAGGGQVYASGLPNGPMQVFQASEFSALAPLREGPEVSAPGSVPPSQEMYVDPSTNELHVDTGNKVVIFDSAHNVVKEFGSGSVSELGGIAVNGGEGPGQSGRAHHTYAVNGSNIVEFGTDPDTYEPIDDPAIGHALTENEVHRWSDFQTTPNGDYALFTSDRSLTGYENRGLRMVYRYDALDPQLDCVSCLPTEESPKASSSLPTHGLGITEDGRAFFNSSDQLVNGDLNGKEDAYEWKDGTVGLISTGLSNSPASLLTVTDDGTDAFFFTRDSLVDADHNGGAMKLYDARIEGGFFILPPSPPCAASDECHGPSSQAAPPPQTGTHAGTGGNAKTEPRGCRKGFVRRHGKCVRRHRLHTKRHHRGAGHGRGGNR